MAEVLTVIPARWSSTRFPGKVLAPLCGRPVVAWCLRAAQEAGIGPVVVATDDRRVARAVTSLGARAVMTPRSLPSGTDRVFAAARRFKAPAIINLQGDEPLIAPETLRVVARLLDRGADMATAVTPLRDPRRAGSRHVVKAALAQDGRALYFSRASLPAPAGAAAPHYQHIGIYGFSRAALRRFVGLRPSPLERAESLEQLRALEDGMSVYAAVVPEGGPAIDTPGDLRRAERLLRRKGEIA